MSLTRFEDTNNNISEEDDERIKPKVFCCLHFSFLRKQKIVGCEYCKFQSCSLQKMIKHLRRHKVLY